MAISIQDQVYIVIGVFSSIIVYLFIHLLILSTQFVNFRRKVEEGNVSASNPMIPMGEKSQTLPAPSKSMDRNENNNSSSILAARGYSAYTGKPLPSNANVPMTPSGLSQQRQPPQSPLNRSTSVYDDNSNVEFYNQNHQDQLSSPSNRPGGGYDNTGFYNQQQPQQQRWSRNPTNNNPLASSQAQQWQQNGQQNGQHYGQQNEMFGEVRDELFNPAADQMGNAAA